MTSRWDELSSRQLFELLRASGEPELREYLIEKHEAWSGTWRESTRIRGRTMRT